jgi:uncharacterized protein (DUF342 family)
MPDAVTGSDGVRLEVDPAGMQAVLHLPARATLPVSAVLDRMMKAGVVAGAVEEALRAAEAPAAEDRALVVACGVPAVQPENARIELQVDFVIRLEEDAEHRIDFREQGRFHEVEAGGVLARLVPGRPGTPGRTVLGRDLPVPPPSEADLSGVAGEGCLLQGDTVVAERAGMVVRRRDGHLDIMPQVEIPGDLDMHWGNIATKLPISIRGDIIAGFNLKSESAVTVRGVIEDARVSVKGDLTCGGILPGKQRVKTHSDLTTKHITGREIKCRNLIVASDLRSSSVFATGAVKAKLVVATRIQCAGSLECEQLGSEEGQGAVVQVGLDPLAIALWRLAAREHDAIADEVEQARALCKRLAMWVKQETDDDKRQELARRLEAALKACENAMRRLAECDAVLNNATLRAGNNLDATVTVTGAVHPGVEVRIGADTKLVVTRTLGRTVFRRKDGQVVWE